MRFQDLDPVEASNLAALLDEALDMPTEDRAPWQVELANREPRLCELVTELLISIADARTGPETPALEPSLVARALTRVCTTASSPEGRRFGPYRALRLLGRGGMGSVWLAERADGMFERQVALKLMHPSLLGGTSHEQFARECRILGALEHPLIARLLDAGVTPEGQPYLAIEYVEGTTLAEYCDAHRLTLSARIALMMQVLASVQHAHQNLVIHRDLKPANILVTREGRVRLLDFGIAKLMTDDRGGETPLTQPGVRALTPDYASPEQIAGRPVSTASDVYSLGVLLYTLLCGKRPYSLHGDSRYALEDAIVSSQPLRPSQRIATTAIAEARSSTPKKMAQALTGDLDTLVLKAIKKEPSERYATADAMLQDLQRYLAGQPIEARPDSAWYRFAKFVKRNKVRASVGFTVGAALFVAAGVSIWQGQLARAQEAVAQREAQRAKVVQDLLVKIFKTNSVLQADPIRARQTTARELLDVGAKLAAESLEGAPEAQQEVLNTLSDMYFQLGLHEEAARMRRQRIRSLQRAYGSGDERVAMALLDFADDVSNSLQRDQGEAAMADAQRILDGAGDTSSEARGWLSIVAAEFQQYLSVPAMLRHGDAAVRHFRQHPGHWSSLVRAQRALGRAHFFAGDLEAAEADVHSALVESERRASSSEWTITPLVQLAEVQYAALKLSEAEANFRRAWDVARRLRGELSGVTLQTQAKLGGFLHATGLRAEGTRLLDEAFVAIGKEKANSTPNAVGAVYHFCGLAQLDEGQIAEAEKSFAAEENHLRSYSPNALPLSRTLLLQAAALTALGRYDVSRATIDEANRLWKAGSDDTVQAAAHNPYRLEQARLLLAQGEAGGAEAMLLAVASPGGAPPLRVDETQAKVLLAHARLLQDRASDAQRLAQAAIDHVQGSALRERFPRLEAEAALRLGQAEQRAGNLGSARVHLDRALALREATDAPSSPWLAEVRIALADCLLDLGERRTARVLVEKAQGAHAAYVELGEHFKAPLRAILVRGITR